MDRIHILKTALSEAFEDKGSIDKWESYAQIIDAKLAEEETEHSTYGSSEDAIRHLLAQHDGMLPNELAKIIVKELDYVGQRESS